MNRFDANAARDLEVRAVCDADELASASALMRLYGEETAEDGRWSSEWGKGYPGFAADRTRLAFWRGALAGVVQIHAETMRLGEARIRTGVISWPATGPEFRARGVARSLLVDAVKYLADHRYPAAILFGEPHVHYPFGFAHCLPDYTINLDTVACLRLDNPFRVRAAAPADWPLIQKIHTENDAMIPCSLLRTAGHLARRNRESVQTIVVLDPQGRTAAYAFAERDGNVLRIDEAGVRSIEWCDALIRVCADIAVDASIATIRLRVPPGHPIASHLRHFPSTHEKSVLTAGGGMLACIAIEDLFEAMVPEWESIVAGRAIARDRTELTLSVDGDPYRIRLNRGVVDCAAARGRNRFDVTREEVAGLITGHLDPRDLIQQRHFGVGDEITHIFSAIFPKRDPYIWPFDRC